MCTVAMDALSNEFTLSHVTLAPFLLLCMACKLCTYQQGCDCNQYCIAGVKHGLALPYRGQSEPDLPSEGELQHVPAGPCRSVLLRSRMIRGTVTTNSASPHFGLGLDGYVQFTSPIRRYGDMLAHYQLKVAPLFFYPCHNAFRVVLVWCLWYNVFGWCL